MKFLLELLVAALFSCCLLAAGNADKRNKDVRAMANKSPGYAIRFNVTGYKEYVLRPKRDYDVFIFFSAPYSMCTVCRQFEEGFIRVATSYKMSDPTKQNDKPLIFGIVDLNRHRQIAATHSINSVPKLVHISPTSLKKSDENLFLFSAEDEHQFVNIQMPAGEILKFVASKTGLQFELHVSTEQKLSVILSVVVGLTIVAAIGYKCIGQMRKYPIFVAVGAALIHTLGTSGLINALQNHTGLFGIDPSTNSLIFFARGQRQQFMGEGLAMALLSFLTGTILFCTVRFRKRFTRKFSRNVMTFLLLAMASIMYLAVFRAHEYKSGVNTSIFFPPSTSVRGPLRFDRGNTF